MERTTWTPSEEEDLVLAAKAGDLEAFDVLARRYRAAALTVARQTLRQHEAEDVAQDSLLSAFKSLPSLSDPSRFSAWFGAIVRNRARRINRARSREPVVLDEVILAYAPSIALEFHQKVVSRQVRCAVAALPEDVRETASLYYLEGWTTPQIAGFLSLPITTVKWRLHTARRLLRDRLASLEEFE